MSDAANPRSGGIITNIKRLMTADGRRRFDISLVLAVVVGAVQGLALVALLPASTALASGEDSWGLSMEGWLIVVAVLAALGLAGSYFQAVENFEAALDFIRTVHRAIGDQVAKLPLGWFRSGFAATASRLASDGVIGVGSAVAHMVAPLIIALTSGVILLIGTWIWEPVLGLALTIAVPVFAVIVWLAAKLVARGQHVVEPARMELSRRVVEFSANQAALRSAGRSTDFGPLADAIEDDKAKTKTSMWLGVAGNLLDGVVGQSVVVALIVLAAGLGLSGQLSAIETVVFIGVALRLNQVLTTIGSLVLGVTNKGQTIRSIDQVLDAPVLAESNDRVALPAAGQIELAQVSFGYVAAKPVLNGVTFTVAPRTMTALVGPSGSGKTTIARLVARFYDADEGSVLVGGVDVRRQPIEQLMNQLSMVFQDVYLFDDTLRANVLVGNPDATSEEVDRAAELAGVSEIVARLPRGWDSLVGEGGKALSGGERQRVSVARALLKGSDIVLLDEATSALDPENEANVVAAVEELRQRSTVLVIAHKLDTIRSADSIVVLADDGSVAQTGTHDELIGVEGRYRDFWQVREQAAGWRLVGS